MLFLIDNVRPFMALLISFHGIGVRLKLCRLPFPPVRSGLPSGPRSQADRRSGCRSGRVCRRDERLFSALPAARNQLLVGKQMPAAQLTGIVTGIAVGIIPVLKCSANDWRHSVETGPTPQSPVLAHGAAAPGTYHHSLVVANLSGERGQCHRS